MTPDYDVGCKRLVMSETWFEEVQRDAKRTGLEVAAPVAENAPVVSTELAWAVIGAVDEAAGIDNVRVIAITGSGGQANSGFMVMTLAPWDERARSQQEIAADIHTRLRQADGLTVAD